MTPSSAGAARGGREPGGHCSCSCPRPNSATTDAAQRRHPLAQSPAGSWFGTWGAAHSLCSTHGSGGPACTAVSPCMCLAGICTTGSLTGTAHGARGQWGDTGYWRGHNTAPLTLPCVLTRTNPFAGGKGQVGGSMGASLSALPAQGQGRMRHQDLQGPSRALESSAGAASGSSGSWAHPAPHRGLPTAGVGGPSTPEPCTVPQSLPGGAVGPHTGLSHPFRGRFQSRAVRRSLGRRGWQWEGWPGWHWEGWPGWHWEGWPCSMGGSQGGVLPLSLHLSPGQPLEGHLLLPAWHQHPGVVPRSMAVPAVPDKGHTVPSHPGCGNTTSITGFSQWALVSEEEGGSSPQHCRNTKPLEPAFPPPDTGLPSGPTVQWP